MLRAGHRRAGQGNRLLRESLNGVARIYNVLFLCTGNSARSILAESLIDHWSGDRFKGYSAGSFPKGEVHPLALDLLHKLGLPSEGMRSKSWNEFARPGAPVMVASTGARLLDQDAEIEVRNRLRR